MDYSSNWSDPDPTLTVEQFELLLNQGDVLATIVAGNRVYDFLEKNGWGVARQNPTVDSHADLCALAGYDSVASATWCMDWIDEYAPPLHAAQCWPNDQVRSQFADLSNQDYPFGGFFADSFHGHSASMSAARTPTILPAVPSRSYWRWGRNENGPPTKNVFHSVWSQSQSSSCGLVDPTSQQNTCAVFQRRAGPSRTGVLRLGDPDDVEDLVLVRPRM